MWRISLLLVGGNLTQFIHNDNGAKCRHCIFHLILFFPLAAEASTEMMDENKKRKKNKAKIIIEYEQLPCYVKLIMPFWLGLLLVHGISKYVLLCLQIWWKKNYGLNNCHSCFTLVDGFMVISTSFFNDFFYSIFNLINFIWQKKSLLSWTKTSYDRSSFKMKRKSFKQKEKVD